MAWRVAQAALPPWDRPPPRRSLPLRRRDVASRLAPRLARQSLRQRAATAPCCLTGHRHTRLGAHGARARPRHQHTFLFGEFLKGLVEQLGWHFHLGWSRLDGSRLCRGSRLRSPPGRCRPRCRFGGRGGGFCRQLRRRTNQLLRFFGNLIEGARADFVLEFQKGFQQVLRGVADIPEYRHRPARLYRHPSTHDSRGPSMAHPRSHNTPSRSRTWVPASARRAARYGWPS